MKLSLHLYYLFVLTFLLIRETIGNKYKAVCYLKSGLVIGRELIPEDVEANLCTHIIIGWSTINNETWQIEPEPMERLNDTYYASWTKLKETNNDLKIMISVGSIFYSDTRRFDLNRKFSQMVNSPELRRIFVQNTVKYLRENNFDGIELSWIHPTCWLGKCDDGPPTDRQNYAELVKELHQAFANESQNRTVLVHLQPWFKHLDIGHDVKAMNAFVEFFVVKTWNFYHPDGDAYLEETALLYSQRDPNKTVDGVVRYLLGKEVDRDKIVITIPPFCNTFYPATSSYKPGAPHDPTKSIKGYYQGDVCTILKDSNWTVRKSGEGTYAYKGSEWISFDDVDDIVAKAKYVQANKLGGVMFFLHGDDTTGQKCCTTGHKLPWFRLLQRNLQNNESNAILCPNSQLSIATMQTTTVPGMTMKDTTVQGITMKTTTVQGMTMKDTTVTRMTIQNMTVPFVVIGIICATAISVIIGIIVIIALRRKGKFNSTRRGRLTIPSVGWKKFMMKLMKPGTIQSNRRQQLNDIVYEKLIDNSHEIQIANSHAYSNL